MRFEKKSSFIMESFIQEQDRSIIRLEAIIENHSNTRPQFYHYVRSLYYKIYSTKTTEPQEDNQAVLEIFVDSCHEIIV